MSAAFPAPGGGVDRSWEAEHVRRLAMMADYLDGGDVADPLDYFGS